MILEKKKYLFEKIIGICRILMSETLYTMDILAHRIFGHGSVTIATKMLSFLFTAERCKRPLYITRITPNSMILRKNYLFQKMQVFAFTKL